MKKKRPSERATRTTISIPPGLKKRMDNTVGVNWSLVACSAFEDKLAEIAANKETRSMQDVIDRLKASKRRVDSEAYETGWESGEAWARQHAEVDEFRALEELVEAFGSDEHILYDDDWPGRSKGSAAISVAQAIDPRIENDAKEAIRFWSAYWSRANTLPDGEFVRGFVAAALDVWGKVESKI